VVTRINEPGDWWDHAHCRYVEPEAFFPTRGHSPQPAIRICQTCPVKQPCLTYALTRTERLPGVWGGTTEQQRAKMRREAS
jgi:WhiB family redox-sensing transcriptional regulator